MLGAKELNQMRPQRRKDFCKTIAACADAWFAADPAREEAFWAWLPQYEARRLDRRRCWM